MRAPTSPPSHRVVAGEPPSEYEVTSLDVRKLRTLGFDVVLSRRFLQRFDDPSLWGRRYGRVTPITDSRSLKQANHLKGWDAQTTGLRPDHEG